MDAGSSSSDQPGGFKLKFDPTSASNTQAVVDKTGKKVGNVKKVGGKFTGSHDNHSAKHPSAQAALRAFAAKKDDSDDDKNPDTTPDGDNDSPVDKAAGKGSKVPPQFMKKVVKKPPYGK